MMKWSHLLNNRLVGFGIAMSIFMSDGHASPIAITTVKVKPENRVEHMTYVGLIQAKNTALVQAETPGPIKTIYHYPGDKVTEGTILLELDDTTQKIKLNVAQEVFAKANVGYNTEELNFNRAKVLYENHAISASAFEMQNANHQSITSAFNNAKSNLDVANLNLSNTKVKAPISGTVSELKVLQHSIVGIGTPLFVITSIDKLTAIIPLPEELRPYISIGSELSLKNPSLKKIIKTKISGINTTMDQKSHSFDVYVDFNNPGDWYPGNTIQAELNIKKGKAFSIPQNSVVFNNGFPQVFVIDNHKAHGVRVKEISIEGNHVWVKAPLKEGVVIAVKGASNLFSDAEVYIQ